MFILKHLFDSQPFENNKLRIIITRHGERADLALGSEWTALIPTNGNSNSPISHLTRRADIREWEYDPPLTTHGEHQAISTGRKLLKFRSPIDYCYSSPSYRSIQTANKILEGQGRKYIPINIEPGMFECPSWYDGAFSFIPPNYLTRDRYFNVNPYYKPIYGDVDVKEDEKGFYHRSRFLVESIINAHKNRGGNILLSGHAGSIEAITRGMLQRSARPERLRHESNKVDYCNFAILDRDAYSGEWSVYLPESSEYPYGGQQLAQTSIPLYSASSQYLLTNRVRGAKTPRRAKSYRNSFHY